MYRQVVELVLYHVKSLMGLGCTTCAKGLLWGARLSVEVTLGLEGLLQRARDSSQWKSKGDPLGLSQEVNEYRTREYHYN